MTMIITSTLRSVSKKRPRIGTSRVLLHWITILTLLGRTSISGAQSTCTFSDVTFQAGDILGDAFQTRCGESVDFPCFCDPDRDPPIDCPYCGIATDVTEQGIICARVGGPFIQVINLEGVAEECSCNRDVAGNPQSTCLPPGTSNGDNPAPAPAQNDVCILEWADGSIDVFQDGESYGELFQTGCGPASQFPCFCNVSTPSKLYCPYCTVPAPSGDLVCGGIGETFAAIDENSQVLACFCDGNLGTECSPVAISTPTPVPTTAAPVPTTATPIATTAAPILTTTAPVPTTSAPALVPSLIPSDVPSISPTLSTTELVPSLEPTTVPSTRHPTVSSPPIVDKPSVWMPSRTPPVVLPMPGCTITDGQGNETFVPAGEIVTVMDGPCSPVSSYPVICNPNLPGRVEYPYCVFSSVDRTWESNTGVASSSDPFLVCAQHGEQVSVRTLSDSEGVACSCLYLNPYIGAVSSCPEFLVSVRMVWTASPTESPSPDESSLYEDEPSSSPQTIIGSNGNQNGSSSDAQVVRSCPTILGLVGGGLVVVWALELLLCY